MTLLAVALLVLAAPPGVIVEEVQPGSAAHEAGLEPGDVLLEWEREASPPAHPDPARGTFVSPFDVPEVEAEQAPRGQVTLIGRRNGEPLRLEMSRLDWEMVTRPRFGEVDLAAYEEGRKLADGSDPAAGLERWRATALTLEANGNAADAAWLLYRVARTAARKQRWDDMDTALSAARRAAQDAGDVAIRVRVHGDLSLGRPLTDANQWDRAIALHRSVLEVRQAAGTPSLVEARILSGSFYIAHVRGNVAEADELARRSLAIRERLAPGSLEVARSIFELGLTAWTRGELAQAEQYYRQTLEIRERVAPGSMPVAQSLNNVGLMLDSQGDLATGEEYYRRALEIQERRAPGSLPLASTLHNLGRVASFRGDLDGSEDYYRRSLAIKERLAPVSLTAANSLTNLGVISFRRGELDAAEEFTLRALAVMEKVAPKSLTVAASLENLAAVARERGDFTAAEAHVSRAVELADAIAPGSLEVASHLATLGDVLRRHGSAAKARATLERAVAIVDAKGPATLQAAEVTQAMGELAYEQGDLAASEAHYRRSREIRRSLAPDGDENVAAVCRGLAAIERRQGRKAEALDSYRCALDALDAQRQNLGGSDEVRAGFGARYAAYYRDTIDLLLELNRPEEAFQVLERYRARGLLALLAERDLAFTADVPPELDKERRITNAEYERTLERLGAAKPEDGEKLRQALAGIRRRQAAVRDRIRAASPRLAALQYAEPLDLAATRATLDAGTVLLSYAFGEERGYVFAVGPGPSDFTAVRLEVGTARLREDVAALRRLLERERTLGRQEIHVVARRLSDLLLRPIRGPIARAERVLVVPDGPLHLVPFAALGDPVSAGRARFLAESKPVHVAASVTVFAELKKGRRADRVAQVVAFGDPDYSAVTTADTGTATTVRSAVERGLDLRPLPASRAEVEGLGQLYGAQVYVGAQATEEKAKSVGKDASLVHFACHGLADEKSPLDSSLALSLPVGPHVGRENGLLHAWEIFEQVRLDADLVTLSACGTALGKEMSGEGILGLTRAFQYAGARTVLASLWPVADESTSTLMRSFYGYLKQGQSKDRALRAAQLDMIKSGASHPYRWAAFQLVGDWR
jgi:CHAT domain-containing protein/Tfp pilus assembly protein PilF